MRAGGPPPGGCALRVGCWGCGRRLAVPAAPGAPGRLADLFRCAWCGAVSALEQPGEARVEVGPPGPGGGARRTRRAGRGRRWGERALVGAVAALVAGLALGGLRLLSGLRGSRVVRLAAGALLAVLVANVYFNYSCAVLRSPGEAARLRPPPPPPGPAVARGSLEGFRFCAPCAAPKHPRDHHCRVCRRCVVEMDHHCPFIANCVGRHNLRHFLLFLLYACLGLAEVVAVAVAAFLQAGAPRRSLTPPSAPERGPPSAGAPVSPGLGGAGGLLLRAAATAAARGGPGAAAAALLAVLAGALGLALAALLALQLRLAAEGASAVDKRQQAPPTGGGLRRVFGAGHPLTWALPALGAPRGTPGGGGSWAKEA